MRQVSANTKATLLLTAPLLVGRKTGEAPLLKPSEYRGLARRLRELGATPADLFAADPSALLRDCADVASPERIRLLTERGFQLAQALEQWESRGIWVVGRGDEGYPRGWKERFRDDAPSILFGCGNPLLLTGPGLAVVGSRNLDDAGLAFAREAGRLAAEARISLVSGGARGADEAAMVGALDAGGTTAGVLADSLAKAVLEPVWRDAIRRERAVLVSPYDPAAGFLVGHAMARNRLIYGLASAGLVVSTDFNKGGTWAGAVEQLERLRQVPVYVRLTRPPSKGALGLLERGGVWWPEVGSGAALRDLLAAPVVRAAERAGADAGPVEQELFGGASAVPEVAVADEVADASAADSEQAVEREVAPVAAGSPPSTGEVELAKEPVAVQEGERVGAPVAAASKRGRKAPAPEPAALRAQVLALLESGPKELRELAAATGQTQKSLEALLQGLKADGGLVTVSGKRWTINLTLGLF